MWPNVIHLNHEFIHRLLSWCNLCYHTLKFGIGEPRWFHKRRIQCGVLRSENEYEEIRALCGAQTSSDFLSFLVKSNEDWFFFNFFLSAAIGFLLVRGIVGPVSMVSCGLCFQSVVIHHLSTDTGELAPGLLFGCNVSCFKRFSHLDKGLF